ncbi:DUF6069 family protein [Actinomycetospora rhizophila]|uniref:DUF6069 family protein n=1 Tax=Actinomycetospora rhizophila TaxID=1416876 RepID=A0ABV9ZE04_9PSEU
MSSTVSARTVPPAASPGRIALAVVLAAVAAAVVNTLIGLLVGVIEGTGYNPTTAITFSVIGVLAGFVGWVLVRRLAPRPAAVLRWLVPLVVVLSFVPDLYLLTVGLSVLLVVALMIMHVVVAAVAVPAFRRVLPV